MFLILHQIVFLTEDYFLKNPKAYDQANLMIKDGAKIIDVGGDQQDQDQKQLMKKMNGKE